MKSEKEIYNLHVWSAPEGCVVKRIVCIDFESEELTDDYYVTDDEN
jgi:hypothetical protein